MRLQPGFTRTCAPTESVRRPVLLVFDVDGATGLAAIENAAAGAVVCVVSRKPGPPTDFLTNVGYKRTTNFFRWRR